MDFFTAINSFSSNMESLGSLFGQVSSGLKGVGSAMPFGKAAGGQSFGGEKEFKAYLEQFMGAEQAGNIAERFMGVEQAGNVVARFMGTDQAGRLMEQVEQVLGPDQAAQFMEQFQGANQADKFLAGLKQKGLDPERFLADLQSEGIDPEKFLADLNREGVTPNEFLASFSRQGNRASLSLNEVAEKAAALGGLDLKKFIAKNDSVVSNILSKNRLSLKTEDIQDTPFSFMKGGPTEGLRELAALLDSAKAALPDTFKKQLGQSLVALAQGGRSANSMKMGADLMGAKNGVNVLKDMLETMKGELSVLKLDKEALPALGELMADSGLDNETVNTMLAQLAQGEMELDKVFYTINKANNDLNQKGSLIATEEGLTGLGQFFSSVGASPEVVDSIVGGFELGEKITASALKDIIGAADDKLLNAPISAADAENLGNCLKAMGASSRQLNGLANLLTQTEGKMSVNDFANFFDQMGPGQDVSVGSKELELIKTIMANISREQELAKTPVFNEVLTKIQALGDQEIDEEFTKLSPALQALRGGISSENAESSLGGQMGQNGQPGQQHDREAREQYRQALHAVHTGADTAGAGVAASETVQSYGYGGQESVARQISQKILYSHSRNIHRLRMKLNPESMGGLDIELRVKDGELTAHIRAESRETYEALADEIDELKTALAEGGVKLGNMTLAFDDQQSGHREFARPLFSPTFC